MKILMLNTFDEGGGAARAAFRLNRGLRDMEIDSHLLVQFKSGDATDVVCDSGPFVKLARQARIVLDSLPVRIYEEKPLYNFAPAWVPERLASRVGAVDHDLLHLHWMSYGFMRLETLRKFRKPMVWTLHDSWAFTGGCHVPFECTRYRQRCGACPVLGSLRENDLSRRVWRRKAKAWRGLNLTVVAPSRWLADCARSSSLFSDFRIETIPNGLDLSVFKPVDKKVARELLRLPQEKKLILFGAVAAASDRNKGFHLLLPALQKVAAGVWKEAAQLVIFGASEPVSIPPFGMKAHYLGQLHDEVALAVAYAAADVFVAPSVLENLPYTVMEAMACGTPCVAFNQGGMADLIEHGRTGFLAKAYEPDDLALATSRLLEDDATRRKMAERARRKVEAEFAIDKVAQRYAGLYREILRGERPRSAAGRCA